MQAGIWEEKLAGNSCRYEKDEEADDEGVVACPETCFGVTPSGLKEVDDICLDVLARGLDSFLCAETWPCASGSEP